MTCSGCRHWTANAEPEEWEDSATIRARLGWGACARMESADDAPLDTATLAVGIDAESYRARVFTAAMFSCAMFAVATYPRITLGAGVSGKDAVSFEPPPTKVE